MTSNETIRLVVHISEGLALEDADACRSYWERRVDEAKGQWKHASRFVHSVEEIAFIGGRTVRELRALVAMHAPASSPDVVCPSCGQSEVFTTRTQFLMAEKATKRYLCEACRALPPSPPPPPPPPPVPVQPDMRPCCLCGRSDDMGCVAVAVLGKQHDYQLLRWGAVCLRCIVENKTRWLIEKEEAPKASAPIVSSSCVKHRIALGDSFGIVQEYAGGRSWACLQEPFERLGNFPTLESARQAVVSGLMAREEGTT